MMVPQTFLILLRGVLKNLENAMRLNGGAPAMALAVDPHASLPMHKNSSFTLRDLIGDGFLWAVPKHRRSVEKRLNRKFGYPEYVWKPLKEKRNLRTCTKCGHDYELGLLCRKFLYYALLKYVFTCVYFRIAAFCYDKVRQETELMQDKIQAKLGLDPIEKEVVVLYEGEKASETVEDHTRKVIVEIQKPRPMWFTKNLLQKSTQQSSDSKEVKPSELA